MIKKNMIKAFIYRDFKILTRKSNHLAYTVTLLITTMLISSFTQQEFCAMQPVWFWFCIVTTLQLSINHVFEDDYKDGLLEQIIMHIPNFEFVLFTRIISYWLTNCIPTSICASVTYTITNDIPFTKNLYLIPITSIGTLLISIISSTGHALTIGRNGTIAVAQLLIMPLLIPTILCMNYAFNTVINEQLLLKNCLLFGTLIACSAPISIMASSFAIRLAVEQD